MRKYLTIIELFLRSSHFYSGVRLSFAVVIPLVILNFLGLFEYAPPIVIGAFLNAPGDIPGSLKRKVNAILISAGLTMLITAIILFLKPFAFILIGALAIISFFISFLSIYGFRASLVSFSGLLAMVLAFAIQKETAFEIWSHVLLMGVGGLWYLIVSYVFLKLAPNKDANQLLSETLHTIGEYLRLRARLLTKKADRETLMQQSIVLQTQITEKQETLRELLLLERKRSGRSHYDEKQLLIFISTINIVELIEAKHLDYSEIDALFENNKGYLKASKKLNKKMGNHLITLSEILIQKDKIPSKDLLLEALQKARGVISTYVEDVTLPKAREGALILKNLFDYQEQLFQEIRAIRRVMANVKHASKVSVKRQEESKFLTLQEYRFNVIIQNFSLQSTLFRHSLRFTVAILFAYVLGTLLGIHNGYWILLTIVVIMRPNYGLTKERSKDRIVGTLIGAVIAIGIVLVTQNTIIYSVLAIISLTMAFALIQQNYKSGAAFITLNIIFVYSLINPDALEVIQYRVIDTVLGAGIAVIANYTLWPSWEALNMKHVLLTMLQRNTEYLIATQKLYHDKTEAELSYKVARKEAFLAISNLNGAFQRMTQDPKSKQKEYRLLYDMVTLNQTMISGIASIGTFVTNHQTTPASKEFDTIILKIVNTLRAATAILEDTNFTEEVSVASESSNAEKKIMEAYQHLSELRDRDIKEGNTEIDTETLHHLQEAYLMANQLVWMKALSENLKKATLKYDAVLKERMHA
ncbi:FUSC family protein [Cochleicola gelatinilyticus]|uniref:Uncharacterized protein n=1 Tax=Cochleicola gelatinilyticus TaxID=1763537 RepID=A0A167HIF0_9FLAO|nr:FUSC family membrane protein [Cochleicola gelatinilyticus]OAB78643.1 hypothetical protein ULVI_08645 [Cochleicola gelatinilyticus]